MQRRFRSARSRWARARTCKTTARQQAMLEGQPQSRLAPVPGEDRPAQARRRVGQHRKLPPRLQRAAAALQHVADQVEQAMDQLVKKNMVTVRRNDFWIEVEIAPTSCFQAAAHALAAARSTSSSSLGDVLAPFPNPIRVEGHTDNKPIKTAVFSRTGSCQRRAPAASCACWRATACHPRGSR